MNSNDFQKALTAFADQEGDFDFQKSQFVVQVRDEIIAGQIIKKDGVLYVREDEEDVLATKWLVERVARLSTLADRILSLVSDPVAFVHPSAQVLGHPESDKGEYHAQDAIEAIHDQLETRFAGTTSIVYLTSDAGEGKTTSIEFFARQQANRFKNKESNWLLVPIPLGGRGFVNFDDAVIAALVNKLRFQNWYFDGFVELVRLGYVVPAFDGFEEMFAEGASREAWSSLGNLVRQLAGEGAVLIAARKAYFEYHSLRTQAMLFDAVKGTPVAFAKVALDKWSKEQFVTYGQLRGVRDPDAVYRAVSKRLTANHPLVTRAVLVKKLLDFTNSNSAFEQIVERVENAQQDYMYQFVAAIVEREAHEKWVDRSGDPPEPLLTSAEHFVLLASLAQEMWLGRSELLKGDVLDLICDMFSDAREKPALVARQIKERVRQHALIVTNDAPRGTWSFDHDDFRKFFLGEAVGKAIGNKDTSELRQLLSAGAFPWDVVDQAVNHIKRSDGTFVASIERLSRIAGPEPRTSFVKENAGALIMAMLHHVESESVVVDGVLAPIDSLRNRNLSRTKFRRCIFLSTTTAGARMAGAVFEKCQFEKIEISDATKFDGAEFLNCKIASVSIDRPNIGPSYYNPEEIDSLLVEHGAKVLDKKETQSSRQKGNQDERLAVTGRALRVFLRANHANESFLRMKLGKESSFFFEDVVPTLIRNSVFEEVQYKGSGVQRRFRLGRKLEDLEQALGEAQGSFDAFIRYVTSKDKPM